MIIKEAYAIIKGNTPFRERHELYALMEGDTNTKANFDAGLLDTLYRQIDQFRRIDFSEISKSKGNLRSLSFFNEIEKALDFLSKESVDHVHEVREAWSNIKNRAKTFEVGFKLEKDFIKLNYNTLVLSCIDAVSYLISSVGAVVGSGVKATQSTSIACLTKFNTLCASGKFDKAMGAVMKIKEDQKVTEAFETPLVMAFSIGAMLLIVPLIRELIFYFYFLRMKISNYLDQINKYIEINEVEVKSNPNLTSIKKDEIIRKQNTWRENLGKISDKIRVNQVTAEKQATKKMEETNKDINLATVKGEMSSNSGFEFA